MCWTTNVDYEGVFQMSEYTFVAKSSPMDPQSTGEKDSGNEFQPDKDKTRANLDLVLRQLVRALARQAAREHFEAAKGTVHMGND